MKANVNKAPSDVFECKSEIYQCLRNSIDSANTERMVYLSAVLTD